MQNYWVVKDNEEGDDGITVTEKVNRAMEAIFTVEPSDTRMKFNYLNGVSPKIYLHPQPFELARDREGPNSKLL